MMRLILVVAFMVVVAIAILALLGTMHSVAMVTVGKDEDNMPNTFKRIAYVALVVLLLGVASGCLGAA
jgi:type II secretory pathway component PulJ